MSRRIFSARLVATMAICAISAVVIAGCSGGVNSGIGSAVDEAMAELTAESTTETAESEVGSISSRTNGAFDAFTEVGVDAGELADLYYDGFAYTLGKVTVGEDQETATVSIKITGRSYSEIAGKFYDGTADVMVTQAFLDLDKSSRYEECKTRIENRINAVEPEDLFEIEVSLMKDGDSWVLAEGALDEILETMFPSEDVAKIAEAVECYKWCFDDTSSADIVQAFADAGLSVASIETYDEVSDPNSLLGRPGKYTQKTNFIDSRIDDPYGFARYDGTIDPAYGGSIEIFASKSDRASRGGFYDEYTYSRGNVLLRLSFDLTPEQAAEYEEIFMQYPQLSAS